MRSRLDKALFVLGIGALLCVLSTTAASAWWNESWEYRKKVNLDTTVSGAEVKANLSEVTVLLRLHSGNLNFTNAKEGGADLRFVGSGDQNVLQHQVEMFDSLEEMALVWVKIPVLSGSTRQHIWMYYGNQEAEAVKDTGRTFEANHVGVYHLAEAQGPPQDSSAYGNDASEFSLGQGFATVIGQGASLSGSGDRVVIPFAPSMDFSEGLTFSAWVKLSGPVDDGYLFADEGGQSFVVGIDGASLYARAVTQDGEEAVTDRSAQVPVDSWHQIAVTAEPGGRLTVYLDGTRVSAAELPGQLPAAKNDLIVGSAGDGTHFFQGDVDEVRISKTPRSEDWIRATYFSEGPEQGFVSLGTEEVGEGGGGIPVFYLGTIFGNITLEGWLIIGILIVMALFSWLVVLTKAFFLKMTERDNNDFMDEFNQIREDLAGLYSEDSDYQNSSLYAIYAEGCQDLMGWMDSLEKSNFDDRLMSKAVNSMKSALERRFVKESQRLNAWLVVLTVAVSGGPFLGLLGTVWGVMNTFAAMALAGEANLMAIAPGVASALSTTVFGLIVAIPALFGYNYLTTKIKNITAEMNIFVDHFAVKVEEALYKG